MEAVDQSDFGATWYCGITPLPPPRSALNYDLDVDVCVIGGGLAGLTVAREVVRRGWSVALLEARRVAWNASGRNSGFVLPGFPSRIETIVERIGLPAGKALWALSEAGMRYVRATAAEMGAPAIIEGEGWLDVSKIPNADAALARVSLLGQEIGAEIEGWPIERIRDVLKTSHYFHAIHFPGAFHINPLAYALGLADAAERAGAHIFEATPAVAIDPAGIRKRVATPKGRVRAGHIVLAGNVFVGGVAQRLTDTLVKFTAWTGVTKPIEGLAAAIAYSGAISDSPHGNYHYRIVGGDRLLWTGGASVVARRAAPMKRRLESAIRAIYPQLGPVAFETFWSGEMGIAIHGMPQIGEVQPGVWLASGFGGQGIATSAIAGDLLARAMVEGDDTWRNFLPFELVWAGGRAGRAVAQATIGWRRTREALVARLARRQEEMERRRVEAAAKAAAAAEAAAAAAAAAAEAAKAQPAYRSVEIAHPPTEAPAGAGTAAPADAAIAAPANAEAVAPNEAEAVARAETTPPTAEVTPIEVQMPPQPAAVEAAPVDTAEVAAVHIPPAESSASLPEHPPVDEKRTSH